jgi:hypothetical protein
MELPGPASNVINAQSSLRPSPDPQLVDMKTPPTDWDKTAACYEFLLFMIPSGVMVPCGIRFDTGFENCTDLWVLDERIRGKDRNAQRLLQFESEEAYVMPKMLKLMQKLYVIHPTYLQIETDVR